MNALVEAETEAETPKVAPKPRRPGSVLRDERKTQGLSIEEVATELRLPGGYVNALEIGDYAKLPGDTFVRGYLRNYAAFLDIDPVPLLEAYDRSVRPKNETPSNAGSRQPRAAVAKSDDDKRGGVPVWVIVGVAVALILGAWLSGAFQSKSADSSPVAPESTVAPKPSTNTAAEPVKSATVSDGLEAGAASLESKADASSLDKMSAQNTATQAAVDGVADSVPETGAALASTSTEVLEIVFTKDCWIRVRDGAGKNLSFGVKKAGEVLRLDAGAPYSLLIGNVEGVSVTYNGKPVDLDLYNDKNVAKFILK